MTGKKSAFYKENIFMNLLVIIKAKFFPFEKNLNCII